MTRSLHDRIRSELEAAILSGALGPGDRLPTERELMARYDCARMTVSKALSTLTATGLIERRRRAGSFVAQPRVHSMVLDIPDLRHEIEARGQRYGFALIRRETRLPSGSSADEMQLAGTGSLLAIEGTHCADGRPFAFEERLISLAAVPALAEEEFRGVSPGAWLLHHVPWTEAETRIVAVGASESLAKRLDLPFGTACLSLERRTWRGSAGITQVRQYFAGSTFDLVARFGPAG